MKLYNCDFYVLVFCGFSVASTFDDLSYNKVASQSSTMTGNYNDAKNAVDRNVTTCMKTNDIGGSSQRSTVWWKVDLGRIYSINSVNIFYKNYVGYEYRQRGRFAGFSLYVSTTGDIQGSTLCYKDGPHLPTLNFTTQCIEYGRYLFFYNERLYDLLYPQGYEMSNVFTELCEVIVEGCNKRNVYGSNCDIPCPINCKESTCHIVNGSCFGCQSGWSGTYCNEKCKLGWFGEKCSRLCVGHCKDGATCNHVTGQCNEGCGTGWTGFICEIEAEEIEKKKLKKKAKKKKNSQPTECCDGTYGYGCVNNCSGHCLNDSPCNKQTGYCDSGCNPGYKDDKCSKRCVSGYFGLNCKKLCSTHCLNVESCDHINGACPNGCRDGYIGTRCDRSCKESFYGTNCSYVCSPNCKTCRHVDGLCRCKAGWMGHNCTTKCTKSYGENCNFKCNVLCINHTCDRFNGRCLVGCKDGEQCGTDNIKVAETQSSVSGWTIAFSSILVICLIFISTTFIMLWKYVLKRKPQWDVVQRVLSPNSVQEGTVITDEVSYYQDINLPKEENTYQTLELH